MPIHELGYRPWAGRFRPKLFRWWPIVTSGLRIQFRSKLLLVTLILFGAVSFLVMIVQIAEMMTGQGMVTPKDVRGYQLGVFPFALIMLVFAGAGLISEDRRASAFQIYFARPINRLDYFLGKFCICATLMSLVTFWPSVLFFLFAVMNWGKVPDWGLVARAVGAIFLFSALVTTVTTCVILAVSSLVVHHRLAGFFLLVGLSLLHTMVGVVRAVRQDEKVWYASPLAALFEVGEAIYEPVLLERDKARDHTNQYVAAKLNLLQKRAPYDLLGLLGIDRPGDHAATLDALETVRKPFMDLASKNRRFDRDFDKTLSRTLRQLDEAAGAEQQKRARRDEAAELARAAWKQEVAQRAEALGLSPEETETLLAPSPPADGGREPGEPPPPSDGVGKPARDPRPDDGSPRPERGEANAPGPPPAPGGALVEASRLSPAQMMRLLALTAELNKWLQAAGDETERQERLITLALFLNNKDYRRFLNEGVAAMNRTKAPGHVSGKRQEVQKSIDALRAEQERLQAALDAEALAYGLPTGFGREQLEHFLRGEMQRRTFGEATVFSADRVTLDRGVCLSVLGALAALSLAVCVTRLGVIATLR
ncbi:MAG: hypothetical protein HY719_06505 [Planctomycetes bacterium]|nr:hypothetical protein [Planctomycetota bacterium]